MRIVISIALFVFLANYSFGNTITNYYPSVMYGSQSTYWVCPNQTITINNTYSTCKQSTGIGSPYSKVGVPIIVNWYTNTINTNFGGSIVASYTSVTDTNFTSSESYIPNTSIIGNAYYYCEIVPVMAGCGDTLVSSPSLVSVGQRPLNKPVVPVISSQSNWISFDFSPSFGATNFLIVQSPLALTMLPQDGTIYNPGDAIGNGIVIDTPRANGNIYKINNLIGNTEYNYSIFTYNNCGLFLYKTDTFFKFRHLSEFPTPTVTITNLTSTSCTLNWTSSMAGGWNPWLKYNVSITKNGSVVADLHLAHPTSSYTVTGLKHNTNYSYIIRPYPGYGTKPYSDPPATGSFYTGPNNVIDLNRNELAIYPTITSDYINVKNLTHLRLEVVIMDISGKMLEQRISMEDEIKINVSNLINGIYYINVKSINGRVNDKFIKQ